MRDGLTIIDADCHQWEPGDLWDRYLEPDFQGRAPVRRSIDGREQLTIEGEPLTSRRAGSYANFADTSGSWGERRWLERMREAYESGFSAAARLVDMDRSGVDIQVLYPTLVTQVLGREFQDPELLAACCRAYNNWSRDYCATAPERLRWSAALPLQDVALAIEEAHRSAAEGAVGFFVRPNPVLGRSLHHEDYHPLWAALERLDLPVSLHNPRMPCLPSYGDRMESHSTAHVVSHPFEAMGAVTDLICFGVFERFPALTVITVESAAGWLPFLLERMDEHFERLGPILNPDLTRPPSEYFKTNMFVAAAGDEWMVPAVIDYVGEDNLLFNTDYPHPDGSWPQGIEQMISQPISGEARRKLFYDNPCRAFRLKPL